MRIRQNITLCLVYKAKAFFKFEVFKYLIILVNKNYVPVMNYGDIVKQNNGYLVIQVKHL